MALTGSLSDLGVINLIRVPSSAGKTGELIVAGAESEVRLYYEDGVIHHAVCGDASGMIAVAEMMTFSEGEFEFRTDVTTENRSIDMSIEELISEASNTKTKLASTTRRQAESSSHENKKLLSAISGAARKHPDIAHIAVFTLQGALLCEWKQDDSAGPLNFAVDEVISLIQKHPREGLNKLYFTDSEGTVVATLVNNDTLLMMNSSSTASLGIVSLASVKLSQAVADALQPGIASQ